MSILDTNTKKTLATLAKGYADSTNAIEIVNNAITALRNDSVAFGKSIRTCPYRQELQPLLIKALTKGKKKPSNKTIQHHIGAIANAVNAKKWQPDPTRLPTSVVKAKAGNKGGKKNSIDVSKYVENIAKYLQKHKDNADVKQLAAFLTPALLQYEPSLDEWLKED